MATVGAAAAVSVIIVSYNTREALLKCLGAIDPECEVVVVDNNSSDGSAEAVRSQGRAILIANKENRGFGSANNQGLDICTRPLVLFLNSDATPMPGAIAQLASVFDDTSVVCAGGMLLNPDRTVQNSCANALTLWAVFCEQTWLERLFENSRAFNPYWTTKRLADSPTPVKVHQVMGACLMMRKMERFDERFFLYCEDTDLCERLHRHGDIVYAPKARFHHELGTSTKANRWKGVAFYNCGKELYFRIHHGAPSSYICFVMDRLGALLRMLAWLLITMGSVGTNQRAHANVVAFWRVLWAPMSYKRFRS